MHKALQAVKAMLGSKVPPDKVKISTKEKMTVKMPKKVDK